MLALNGYQATNVKVNNQVPSNRNMFNMGPGNGNNSRGGNNRYSSRGCTAMLMALFQIKKKKKLTAVTFVLSFKYGCINWMIWLYLFHIWYKYELYLKRILYNHVLVDYFFGFVLLNIFQTLKFWHILTKSTND